jgi:hydrogenase-4 component E
MHDLLHGGLPRVAAAARPAAVALPLNALILILLATAILIAIAPTTARAIGLLVTQSVALAAVALLTAIASGAAEIYLSVAATLVVKALLVPLILRRVLRRSGARDAGPMYLGRRPVFILALALVFAAVALVRPVAVAGTLITGSYFPTSVAVLLIGALTMVVRKKALLQVIGLIVVENGVYMAAMATTYGLPPVVEMGIAFDLLITVLLLGSLAFDIGVATASLDTSALRRLRH